MKINRAPFTERYGDLHTKWNIEESNVIRIINEFDWKLIEELSSDEPWTINRYFRDTRTIDEYIYDILEGQLIEALICEWFIEKGCDAKRVGSDASGMLIRSNAKKITTNPDLIVDGSYIELQVSRMGKLKNYHIKKGKGNRIIKGENSLMMVVGNEYFIVDNCLLNKCSIVKNPAWGGKECFAVSNDLIKFKPL